MKSIKIFLSNLIVILLGILILAQSNLRPASEYEQVRAFTRQIEFDYFDWTINAMIVKNVQESLKAPGYMTIAEQRKIVSEYFRLVRWVNQINSNIETIYTNPDVKDPDQTAAELNAQVRHLIELELNLKPIAEAVIQYQVSTTVASLGLGVAGQPIPPVLYHATSLPNALIISPRSIIRQDEDISLEPEMTTEDMVRLENTVEKNLGVSALVVPIGGVGTYPTMVYNTTNLQSLLEVVSHEWTHNYLTIRPLGALYLSSPEMRTINETTANLSGKEIGLEVLKRFYPDLVPPEEQQASPGGPLPTPTPEDPNKFSYNREMHITRTQVDALLAQGKIKEAEDYMEARRRFFWEHGYQIRRLNQAYFAFYGAYNDEPGGGAAGQDPVGPAVQLLRQKSSSLADFLNRISWVTSFSGLEQVLQTTK